MSLTFREFWAAAHGLLLGSLFLLSFAGGVAGLYSLRPELVTPQGVKERLGRLKLGTTVMAIVAWLTVVTGTFIVYPWYRAAPPDGADLTDYPRSFLKADPNLSGWHAFGMEWKEHIAWFAPILATAVAYLVLRYAPELINNAKLRKVIMVIFFFAFATAAIAGLFGAFITKAAPVL